MSRTNCAPSLRGSDCNTGVNPGRYTDRRLCKKLHCFRGQEIAHRSSSFPQLHRLGPCVIVGKGSDDLCKNRRASSRKIATKIAGHVPGRWSGHPLLPSSLPTVCARYRACASPFANWALACSGWECPHFHPAWQGDLRPNFSWAFTPSKINGVITKFHFKQISF